MHSFFCHSSSISTLFSKLSTATETQVQHAHQHKAELISASNNKTECSPLSSTGPSFSYGLSYGAEFCATQYGTSKGTENVISGIKTYSDMNKVRGLQIFFSNNKYMDLGQTSNSSTLFTRKLDLQPFNTSLSTVGGTDIPNHNINGIGLTLSNGESLYAGYMTSFSEVLGIPQQSLLAGLGGNFGTNGLESITYHVVQTASRPKNTTTPNWRRSVPPSDL